MSTWLDTVKRRDPAMAADLALVGNQSDHALAQMVLALSLNAWANTPEDKERLAAAKRILKARG